MRLLFCEKVSGVENIPMEGPLLIAPNHTSYLDPLAVGAFIPRGVHYVGREELFKNSAFARLLEICKCIPIKKEKPGKATIGKFLSLLRRGEALMIFPEGTRSPSGELQEAGAGIGLLALSTGAPIIPALVKGADKALPLKAHWIKLRPIKVCFGKPILPDRFSSRKAPRLCRQEVADAVMRAIAELKHGM